MIRKLIPLLLVVVLMLTMVLALGACGADTGTEEPGTLPDTGGELDATDEITDTLDMTDTGTTGGTTP